MATNVELYEALKPSVGQDAARMIAEVVPPTRDLALRSDVAALRADTREEFARIRGEMHAETNRTLRWIFAFFIPVWAGTWGTVVAILLKG